MAFNGTKTFPRNELVDYIESIGMQFGADLNAYTNFDQTVYMLQVPTDKPELLEKGLKIIEEWGHQILFEDKEIDKERGVILEEERLYRGAEDRIWKKELPIRFYNSKYALRDVIGDTLIIKNAPYSAFKRFYKEWYRPNNMAVIAIGDFDVAKVENIIKDYFSKMENPPTFRPSEVVPVPDNPGTLVSVLTDKELTYPSINITYKHPYREKNDFANLRQGLVESLASNMLYQRYNEYLSKPNPPFMYAYGSYGDYAGNKDAFDVTALGKGDEIEYSYKIMLTELFRAYQTGFTKSEMDRVKNESIVYAERAINERDKTESKVFANQLINYFLQGNPVKSPEQSLEYLKKYYPTITVDEVNARLKEMITKENSIICISAPEKEGIKVPSKEQVLAIYKEYFNKKYDAYVDKVSDKPLFDKKLTPGTITKETRNDKLDWTEFTLSNGAKVIVKKTDFKNDQILIRAFGPGGTSIAETQDLNIANSAAGIIGKSGLGEFDAITLDKMLTGKIANVNPFISGLDQGMDGSSSIKDFETLMQLVHLYFTAPRSDKDAFEAYKSQQLDQINMMANNPDQIFSDSISSIVYNYNPRVKRMTKEDVNKLDLQKALDFYKARFKDASNFTFVFVGSVDLPTIKQMSEKYLATLPSYGHKENWIDRNVDPRQDAVTKKVQKGIEFKSSVNLMGFGDFEYTPLNRMALNSLNEVLNIRLREVIREDKGGTYGAYAQLRGTKYPKPRVTLYSGFGCSPDRVDELTGATIGIFKELKEKPIEQKNVEKVHETFLREMEIQKKNNNFWVGVIRNSVFFNEDPSYLLDYDNMVKKIDAKFIQDAAKKYLNEDKIFKFYLYPEDKKN
jgi:zinc protease